LIRFGVFRIEQFYIVPPAIMAYPNPPIT
jgi:hypothetical protein